jgi:hypothetical protein
LAKDVENPAFEKMDNKAFFSDKYLDYKRRIIENNQTFRDFINNTSQKIIEKEMIHLNIYLYSLCLIILGLVYLIKHDIKPVTKTKKKVKRKR